MSWLMPAFFVGIILWMRSRGRSVVRRGFRVGGSCLIYKAECEWAQSKGASLKRPLFPRAAVKDRMLRILSYSTDA